MTFLSTNKTATTTSTAYSKTFTSPFNHTITPESDLTLDSTSTSLEYSDTTSALEMSSISIHDYMIEPTTTIVVTKTDTDQIQTSIFTTDIFNSTLAIVETSTIKIEKIDITDTQTLSPSVYTVEMETKTEFTNYEIFNSTSMLSYCKLFVFIYGLFNKQYLIPYDEYMQANSWILRLVLAEYPCFHQITP